MADAKRPRHYYAKPWETLWLISTPAVAKFKGNKTEIVANRHIPTFPTSYQLNNHSDFFMLFGGYGRYSEFFLVQFHGYGGKLGKISPEAFEPI